MRGIGEIAGFLSREKVNFSVVGGYAVALHGAVRGTVDLDIIIEHTQEQFEACERALKKAGLEPRLPVSAKDVFQFRREYIERRNLVAWSFYNPRNPIEIVDVIITHDLKGLRSVQKKLGTGRIPVLSIEDLVAMKKASGRPQDLEDIKMLEEILRGKKD